MSEHERTIMASSAVGHLTPGKDRGKCRGISCR